MTANLAEPEMIDRPFLESTPQNSMEVRSGGNYPRPAAAEMYQGGDSGGSVSIARLLKRAMIISAHSTPTICRL
jgi:hypothetical protein